MPITKVGPPAKPRAGAPQRLDRGNQVRADDPLQLGKSTHKASGAPAPRIRATSTITPSRAGPLQGPSRSLSASSTSSDEGQPLAHALAQRRQKETITKLAFKKHGHRVTIKSSRQIQHRGDDRQPDITKELSPTPLKRDNNDALSVESGRITLHASMPSPADELRPTHHLEKASTPSASQDGSQANQAPFPARTAPDSTQPPRDAQEDSQNDQSIIGWVGITEHDHLPHIVPRERSGMHFQDGANVGDVQPEQVGGPQLDDHDNVPASSQHHKNDTTPQPEPSTSDDPHGFRGVIHVLTRNYIASQQLINDLQEQIQSLRAELGYLRQYQTRQIKEGIYELAQGAVRDVVGEFARTLPVTVRALPVPSASYSGNPGSRQVKPSVRIDDARTSPQPRLSTFTEIPQ